MAEEEQRTRLIAEIASLLSSEHAMPPEARAAGLTLIGWLARRMPGEFASRAGVEEMGACLALDSPAQQQEGRRSK
ncbi:hypothetical protein [Chondromyces apiculatus]|uniref:Uncharacterized protein n=1 Tax=Chondromyces apiculatus DSM 436 TaxID=1192034 RepID=A0A017TCL7_9BACT|nr:hypothetical protein [Chondromyces apiculatus]EYF06652.1 Hypothetical protein CAP_1782 [Chondromyces apiculatus DSM 436]